MSQSDEFFDDWSDMSPGFTDRLLQNVAMVERQAAKDAMTRKSDKTRDTFDVFRDPQRHCAMSPHLQHLTRLREIDVNQLDAPDNNSKVVKKDTLAKDAKQVDAATPTPDATTPTPDATILTPYFKSPSLRPRAVPTNGVGSDDEHNWMDFNVDFESMIDDLEKGGVPEIPTESDPIDDKALFNDMVNKSPRNDAVISKPSTCDPPNSTNNVSINNNAVDKKLIESTLNKFGGFVTAGTKKSLKSNSSAREKALSLFTDPTKDNKPSIHQPKDNNVPEKKTMSGFTTGSGRAIERGSETALRKARDLLSAVDLQPLPDPVCGEKRPAEDDVAQFKYEDVLSHYGGFKTGNSKTAITVSAESKLRAISLFNSARDLTQASQSTQSSLSTQSSSQSREPKPKRVKRPLGMKSHTTPFRSPLKVGMYEQTKAAALGHAIPGTVRGKGPKVFSMKANVLRYSLSQLGKPLQHSVHELKQMGVSDEILYLNVTNAIDVQFSGWGRINARKALLDAGALEKFTSRAWVDNHYRWIVWKIACMIRSYPIKFNHWWCREKVVDQLLYRYEREINLGHRSVLKRIHEHDDTPAKHMVLVVAAITELDAAAQADKVLVRKYQLLLSDGWYGISAVTDPRMERAIASKRLFIGCKLSICGAQLVGDFQPHSPLDASSSDTLLSITTNGSRLAAWNTKLGYHPQRLVYRQLSAIHQDGGTVTALDVIVCRKYPMIYTETLPNGTKIKRTAREEEQVRSGRAMYRGGDGWTPPFLEHSGVQIKQFDKALESERNVSAYFRVRICDYSHSNSLATLLLLDATELNHMDICEGGRYRIFFTVPYTTGDKDIHLKTTRKTRWETVRAVDPVKLASTCYIPRHISATAAVSTPDSEVDIAVLVLHSAYTEEKRPSEGRSFWHQTLFVTDASKGLGQVKLRLAGRPMKNIEGQVVGFTNLRHQAYDTKYAITHLKGGDDCETYVKQKAAPYMQQAIQSVHQWLQSSPLEVQEMEQRVKNLMQ